LNDSDRLKDEIRQRIDLVDIVSEHVALRRSGRNLVGLCPFHQEKTPSFSVMPSKQIFKCFGCNVGGDVFTFVQLRESVNFPEAMRILAERAGIDLDRRVGRAPADGVGRADLARVNAWAAQVFRRAFTDPESGSVARAYAEKRRISAEMQEAFGLGWAPEDSGWLINRAKGAGVRSDLLAAAGLIARGAGGDTYSVFRGRLMFPIRDTMNRVIGFGGRTLIDDRAKYLNTPQSALFDKGKNLFGIDRARQAMGSSRSVAVVEGYTDCIAAHQHGIDNVVATLGTALTDAQVNLLRRWCDEVILVFDSDEAGQRAADRALAVALRHNLQVRIAQVTSGKDPADFLQDHGADEFRAVLKSGIDALVFKWHRTEERFTSGSGGGRKEAIQEFVHLVAEMIHFRAVDPIQQGLIVNQLAGLLALPGPEVHRLLVDAGRRAGQTRQTVASAVGPDPSGGRSASTRGGEGAPAGDARQAALTTILQVLLNEPGYYPEVADVFDSARFSDDRTRRIAAAVEDLCRNMGAFVLGELLARFEDPADAHRVTELVCRGEQLGNFEATVVDTAARLRQLEEMQRAREAAPRQVAALAGAPEGRDAEDEWLLRVQQVRAKARGFAPGIPQSVRPQPRE